MIRLIDTFNKTNLVKSPLENLRAHFEFVEEDLSDRWQAMEALSDQDTQIWAAAPDSKILGYDESKLPQRNVSRSRRPGIEFSPLSESRVKPLGNGKEASWSSCDRIKEL